MQTLCATETVTSNATLLFSGTPEITSVLKTLFRFFRIENSYLPGDIVSVNRLVEDRDLDWDDIGWDLVEYLGSGCVTTEGCEYLNLEASLEHVSKNLNLPPDGKAEEALFNILEREPRNATIQDLVDLAILLNDGHNLIGVQENDLTM